MAEDKKVRGHHRLMDVSLSKPPGVGDGQGSLACCSPRGRKEVDVTERLNDNHMV